MSSAVASTSRGAANPRAAAGSGNNPGGAAAAILTGTAATGGPISGTVHLKDASSAGRTLSAATASDGSFSLDVNGLTAPFLLKVVYGEASAPSALYSIATAAGTANITPLTSIATRAAIGGSDLESFFRNGTAADIAGAGSRMPDSVASLQNALSPLLQRFDVQGNLLSTPFTADHMGVDAMMDAISVEFSGALVTVAAKSSGVNLFSAPAANLRAGNFSLANLDQMSTTAPTPGGSLYTLHCAGCHGALSDSAKKGISLARLQAAITNNAGGMQVASPLSLADMRSIVTVPGPATVDLPTAPPATPPATSTTTPPTTPPDGATLYASSCAGCHGMLASSTKLGATSVRIQNAVSGGIGGMGGLSSLTAADIQAIAAALADQVPSPPPNPTPTRTPTPTPTPTDGAALYASSCAGCHGPLGSSTKQGASIARLQSAITNNTGSMGTLSALSVTDVQAIVTALTPATPTPTPVRPPSPPDGTALYASSCAGCHGPLASSAKAGATVTRIQNAISNDTAGMGFLTILSATDVQAIASALALISPATGACGSCHAIPPAVGEHGEHARFTCATCHGVGYGSTNVSGAKHNNGSVDLVNSIGWVAATGSCANSCHGTEKWFESERD